MSSTSLHDDYIFHQMSQRVFVWNETLQTFYLNPIEKRHYHILHFIFALIYRSTVSTEFQDLTERHLDSMSVNNTHWLMCDLTLQSLSYSIGSITTQNSSTMFQSHSELRWKQEISFTTVCPWSYPGQVSYIPTQRWRHSGYCNSETLDWVVFLQAGLNVFNAAFTRSE